MSRRWRRCLSGMCALSLVSLFGAPAAAQEPPPCPWSTDLTQAGESFQIWGKNDLTLAVPPLTPRAAPVVLHPSTHALALAREQISWCLDCGGRPQADDINTWRAAEVHRDYARWATHSGGLFLNVQGFDRYDAPPGGAWTFRRGPPLLWQVAWLRQDNTPAPPTLAQLIQWVLLDPEIPVRLRRRIVQQAADERSQGVLIDLGVPAEVAHLHLLLQDVDLSTNALDEEALWALGLRPLPDAVAVDPDPTHWISGQALALVFLRLQDSVINGVGPSLLFMATRAWTDLPADQRTGISTRLVAANGVQPDGASAAFARHGTGYYAQAVLSDLAITEVLFLQAPSVPTCGGGPAHRMSLFATLQDATGIRSVSAIAHPRTRAAISGFSEAGGLP